MAAEYVSVECDLDEALDFFRGLEKEYPKIRRRMLAGIGSSARNRAKKAYRGVLNKGSGNLYKSIKRGVVKSGKAVVISPQARADNHVLYGYALQQSALIEAKDSDYLTFQIDGKWVKKKSVRLKEHDFMEGPILQYLGSQDYRDQLDKLLAKEITKLEKKGYSIVSSSPLSISGDN